MPFVGGAIGRVVAPRRSFEAPDSETATKVSLLVRCFGHATTETWIATPWERFLPIARGLK